MDPEAKRGGKKPLVLLVDDAIDSRAMYAEYFAIEGFDVIEADDGVQAVATAREQRPAAIIMDVTLPTIDGLEATRRLRSDPTTQDIIVVALTGHREEEMRDRAVAAGVDKYVRKPCLPSDLVAHVRGLLAERATR